MIVGAPVVDPHWNRSAKLFATVESPVVAVMLDPPNGIVLLAAVPGIRLFAACVTHPEIMLLNVADPPMAMGISVITAVQRNVAETASAVVSMMTPNPTDVPPNPTSNRRVCRVEPCCPSPPHVSR